MRDERLWAYIVAAALVSTLVAAAAGPSGVRTALSMVWLLSPVPAIAYGVRRHRPEHANAWWLLAFAFACFAVGWIVLDIHPLSNADLLPTVLPHIPAAPAVGLALFAIVRARGYPRDPDSILDAGIVGVAIGFVAWRALLEPAYIGSDQAIRVLTAATVYPALDLGLMVVLIHLTFSSPTRTTSWYLVLVGVGTILVSDLLLAVVSAHQQASGLAVPVAAAGYAIIAAAAVHPSMVDLTRPTPPMPQHLGPARVGMLGASLLTTPLVILLDRVQDVHRNDGTLLISSGFLSVVVLARMVGLARQADQARRREQARERRFESLVRHSTDLIAVLDGGGQVTYVSPAVHSILGIDQRLVTDRDLTHWLHPDDTEGALSALEKMQEDDADTNVTLRLRHADGSWRWMEGHAVNLLDEPSVSGIVVNCRDVTDRVTAEEVILSSNIQQAAAAELGRHALVGGPVDQLAARTAHLVRSTLGVSTCQLYFVDDHGDVELTAVEGLGPHEAENLGPLDEHPLIEACLESSEVVQLADHDPEGVLPDPRAHAAIPLSSDRPAARHAEPGPAAGTATVIAVRITDGQRPFGVLVARSGHRRRFRTDEASFLESMASTLGLAIARREVEFDARQQALHDTLTGLPNRALFVDRLESALARLDRHEGTVAVLFLDVDHFKVVNDSLGHNAGDRILVSVAERLEKLLRPGDTVARFGGDEFTVLCEDLGDAEDALDVAHRILAELASALEVGRAEIHTTVSIGVAVADQPGTDPEAMLRDADAAMYRAKERGRNRVELFDDTMRSRAVTRLRTELALREAMGAHQLELHYQPVVDVRSGQVLAAEALVRWRHPSDGLVPPAQFIPVAEEAGIINELGRWVLGQALRQLAEWHRRYGPITPVLGVNVSARSLAMPGFPSEVAALLRESEVPPNLVCLEITESALMEDVERSLDVLRQLRNLGLTLAIDDFGTGYSSLSYLKRFPVDVLKIDRSFTDGLGREAEDSAIVAAVVNLAQTLDRLSIAEGVETPLQLRELQRLDCSLAQGFLFSKPVPADQLEVLRGHDICRDVALIADGGSTVGRAQPTSGPRTTAPWAP